MFKPYDQVTLKDYNEPVYTVIHHSPIRLQTSGANYTYDLIIRDEHIIYTVDAKHYRLYQPPKVVYLSCHKPTGTTLVSEIKPEYDEHWITKKVEFDV